jgi:uncharacterized delta-60 repeat protein
VAAQLLDPSFSAPTGLYAPGAVYALGPQQADGKRLVAGTFSRVNGANVAGLVRLDATGATDQAFSQSVGAASNVFRIRRYNAAGQYLLGSTGGIVSAGGIIRNELLRLNANGTADASFDAGSGPDANGFVQEYAVQPDGKVVVTGSFISFNNVPAYGVVRLNANGSVDTGFSVGAGLDVVNSFALGYAVAVQTDGKILIGGDFTTFNGQPANGLVRLNANGSLDTSFGLDAALQSPYVEGLIIQPDGKLLVNGGFLLNNTSASLVRLLPSGSLDPSFSPTAFTAGTISTNGFDPATVLQPDGKILVAGLFDPTNLTAATGVARLNTDGTRDLGFPAITGAGASPYTLGLQADGTVLLGGNFSTLNGRETPLGRLTSTGTPDPGFAPTIQVAGLVSAMVQQPDGSVVIGGNFTELSGQAVHRLARLSAAGVPDAAFTAATGVLPAAVNCLALQPNGSIVAGTGRGTRRFLPTGAPDTGFNVFVSVPATAVALQADGRILVGGQFGFSTGGNTYNGLMRLNANGSHDPSFVRAFTANGTGTPFATDALLVQPDGRVVVGSLFRTSSTGNQTYAGRVVRYETTGALDATFNNASVFNNTGGSTSTTLNRIYSLALQPDGKILAGGNFLSVSGTPAYGVARLSSTGTPDASFAPSASLTNTVFSLVRQPNGRVLLGGGFVLNGPTATLPNLARVLDNGPVDASFGASVVPNGTVRALLVQPDGGIMVAGSFTTIGGQPAVGVARIVAANVLHVAAPAAVAARTQAWPVPAHGQLHIAPDASAQPFAFELLDALGRPVRQQPATAAPEQTLSLDNLPAGVYLLRVRYAAGVVSRRIAVQ